MQRVLASGGELRVVFVTDGDNNPWPQRLMQRKWFLSPADRAAWGATRRHEALFSLALFGITEASAVFLALPDSGIARMAREGDGCLSDRIQKIVTEFQPTLIVSPSTFDLHSDHRAVSYFTHRAAPKTPMITYVVHGSAPADRIALRITLSDREKLRKREAIECHQSQLTLSRQRFLSYARNRESFYQPEFDMLRVNSAARDRIVGVRYAMRVLLGLDPAPDDSGVQAPADVQDGAGDVPGLL